MYAGEKIYFEMIFSVASRLWLINLIINILNEWNRETIDTGYPEPINNKPFSKQFSLWVE